MAGQIGLYIVCFILILIGIIMHYGITSANKNKK
mgnify:CR=1 FL=1